MQFVTLESENKSYPLRDATADEVTAFRAASHGDTGSDESNKRAVTVMYWLATLRLPDQFPADTISALEQIEVVKQAHPLINEGAAQDENENDCDK